jgi:voltage-gated potassium channel
MPVSHDVVSRNVRASTRTAKLIAVAVVRTVIGLVVITIGMLLVPSSIGSGGTVPMIVTVTAGVCAWILYMRWAVRGIRKAQHPRIRSVETLVVSIWLFIGIFASFYVTISAANPEAFTEPLDHFTASYFALTILATVGFGDITPSITLSRSVAMVQMSLDLFLVAVAVRVLTSSADQALKDRDSAMLAEAEAQEG